MGESGLAKLGEPGKRAALLCAALGVSVLVVAMMGTRLSPGMVAASLLLHVGAMWPAAVYLLAGFGLGWPLARLARDCPERLAIQLAAGTALLVSLSEVLGALGLLNAPTAIGACGLGLGLLGTQAALAWRGGRRGSVPGLAWGLACPALAVLLVASAAMPGWLWGSEFGGFDALSYHLQLPQEWLEAGRIEPLEHNVYSYLPGYIEAAFTHLGHLTLAPEQGLLGGDGWRLLACQALHAGLTVLAAWLTSRLARRLALNAGAADAAARWAGSIAGCVALATPWAVVTGSLAYNEAGVNAMLAGALLVCAQPGMSPAVRGGLVGLLIGAACGFKPTALFFAGVPAGLFLVHAALGGERRGRAVAQAVLAGAAVGLVTLGPWLLRNWAFGGNPVFPFASDLFGSAHWTAEQVDRYMSAHSAAGDRGSWIRLLLWTDPSSLPADDAVIRFRGLANPQWGLGLLFGAASLAIVVLGGRRWRVPGLLLCAALAGQITWWAGFTHMQSRFLLPLLPVGAAAIGMALGRLRGLADHRPDGRAAVVLLGGVIVLVQSGFLLGTYSEQRGGRPGQALGVFPEYFAGAGWEPPESIPTGWCNQTAGPGRRVYLVGDSTPLYYGRDVLYHTTYDASPLGELMREHPDDPGAWIDGLRDRGVAWLLVSPSELTRLHASGWYDPGVTAERVAELADLLGGPEQVWPESQWRYAVRLRDPAPAPTGGAD